MKIPIKPHSESTKTLNKSKEFLKIKQIRTDDWENYEKDPEPQSSAGGDEEVEDRADGDNNARHGDGH